MSNKIILIFSSIGLLVVNNLYLYWQFFEFNIYQLTSNKLAMALSIEVFGLMILISLYFKKYPIGPYKWYWLIILSLLGSLLFALPFYYWLNIRHKIR